ncbi:MAG: hypothetical protein LC624_08925 [Halobacteriales archaeon]|nr:hypothetical protein [Halobacteriales archaeon]
MRLALGLLVLLASAAPAHGVTVDTSQWNGTGSVSFSGQATALFCATGQSVPVQVALSLSDVRGTWLLDLQYVNASPACVANPASCYTFTDPRAGVTGMICMTSANGVVWLEPVGNTLRLHWTLGFSEHLEATLTRAA